MSADRIATKKEVQDIANTWSGPYFLPNEPDTRCPMLSEIVNFFGDTLEIAGMDVFPRKYESSELVRVDDITKNEEASAHWIVVDQAGVMSVYYGKELFFGYNIDESGLWELGEISPTWYVFGETYSAESYVYYIDSYGERQHDDGANGNYQSLIIFVTMTNPLGNGTHYARFDGVFSTGSLQSARDGGSDYRCEVEDITPVYRFTCNNTASVTGCERAVFFDRALMAEDEGFSDDNSKALEIYAAIVAATDTIPNSGASVTTEATAGHIIVCVRSRLVAGEVVATSKQYSNSQAANIYPYFLSRYADGTYYWRPAIENFEGLSPEYGGDGDNDEYYYGLYFNNVDDGWGWGYTLGLGGNWTFRPGNPKNEW